MRAQLARGVLDPADGTCAARASRRPPSGGAVDARRLSFVRDRSVTISLTSAPGRHRRLWRMEPLRSENSPPTSRSSGEVRLGEISVHAQTPKALPRTCPWGRAVTPQSPLGSVVIPAHDEAAVIGRVLTPCSPASWRASWTSSSSVTAARTRPRGWPGHRVTRSGCASCGGLQARRAAEWRRAARAFPRLYLDADVLMPGSGPASCWSACGPGRSPPDRRSGTR